MSGWVGLLLRQDILMCAKVIFTVLFPQEVTFGKYGKYPRESMFYMVSVCTCVCVYVREGESMKDVCVRSTNE